MTNFKFTVFVFSCVLAFIATAQLQPIASHVQYPKLPLEGPSVANRLRRFVETKAVGVVSKNTKFCAYCHKSIWKGRPSAEKLDMFTCDHANDFHAKCAKAYYKNRNYRCPIDACGHAFLLNPDYPVTSKKEIEVAKSMSASICEFCQEPLLPKLLPTIYPWVYSCPNSHRFHTKCINRGLAVMTNPVASKNCTTCQNELSAFPISSQYAPLAYDRQQLFRGAYPDVFHAVQPNIFEAQKSSLKSYRQAIIRDRTELSEDEHTPNDSSSSGDNKCIICMNDITKAHPAVTRSSQQSCDHLEKIHASCMEETMHSQKSFNQEYHCPYCRTELKFPKMTHAMWIGNPFYDSSKTSTTHIGTDWFNRLTFA